MKKNICIFFSILFAFLANPQNTLAYGGGGGFPPVFDPLPRYKLECEYITQNLQYNWSLKIPKCKVVKYTVENENISFSERANDFFSRVLNGGR